jgi:hypothetical protein
MKRKSKTVQLGLHTIETEKQTKGRRRRKRIQSADQSPAHSTPRDSTFASTPKSPQVIEVKIGHRSNRTFVKELVVWNPKFTEHTSLVIKQFYKHARSSPENQAWTLYVLELLLDYFKRVGLFSEFHFEIAIVDVITFKRRFLVLEDLGNPDLHQRLGIDRTITADHLPYKQKRKVFNAIYALAKAICLADDKLVTAFQKARYFEHGFPSLDLIPSNVVVGIKGKRIRIVWIIDQFSEYGPFDYELRIRDLERMPKKWFPGLSRFGKCALDAFRREHGLLQSKTLG